MEDQKGLLPLKDRDHCWYRSLFDLRLRALEALPDPVWVPFDIDEASGASDTGTYLRKATEAVLYYNPHSHRYELLVNDREKSGHGQGQHLKLMDRLGLLGIDRWGQIDYHTSIDCIPLVLAEDLHGKRWLISPTEGSREDLTQFEDDHWRKTDRGRKIIAALADYDIDCLFAGSSFREERGRDLPDTEMLDKTVLKIIMNAEFREAYYALLRNLAHPNMKWIYP